jgi:hypothetical protein
MQPEEWMYLCAFIVSIDTICAGSIDARVKRGRRTRAHATQGRIVRTRTRRVFVCASVAQQHTLSQMHVRGVHIDVRLTYASI